ncbi:MAG TPA: MBL fold metallo-hydrolase [Actinomycetaceae bacterium]|nr:MBL fold metallo-hydrolase [Actinomycetaceae bacterium]
MLITTLTATVFAANCLILSKEGAAVVVDPGAGTAARVAAALRQAELELKAVYLTHGHPDHVWEAAAVAGELPVFISADDAPLLEGPAGEPGSERALQFAQMAGSEWVAPSNVVTFTPGEEVAPAEGFTFRTFAAPGHTPGSVLAVLNEHAQLHGDMAAPAIAGPQQIVLTGDVIFAGSIGRTDLPGGDPAAMRDTLRTVPPQLPADAVLLPGHGPATRLADELVTNPFLVGAQGVG